MLAAGRPEDLGLGGSALLGAFPPELGDRGLCRSRLPGAVVGEGARGGHAADQSFERRYSDQAAAGEPILPEFAPILQPTLATCRVDSGRERSLGGRGTSGE